MDSISVPIPSKLLVLKGLTDEKVLYKSMRTIAVIRNNCKGGPTSLQFKSNQHLPKLQDLGVPYHIF